MKKTILLMIVLAIFSPFSLFAQEANVGIIKGIWFSDTQFFEGDMIRVYTAVQNNSGSDVEGTIEFFDNGESLGEKEFSALDGRIIESWIDTLAISGEHEFSVKINQLQKNDIGSGIETITAQSTFSERIAVVKIDTDGDRISDDIDTDDDGDGYSDKEEQESGSNPLDKNDTPKDAANSDSESILSAISNTIKDLFTSADSEKNEDEITDSEKEAQDTENSDSVDFTDTTPVFIQKLGENSELVQSLSSHITNIQGTSQDFIEKEQSRIKNSPYPKTEKISTNNNSESVDLEVSENNKQNFLTTLYSWVLDLFSWLFSVWWFVVILLFIVIYIFLRLLFRIFGKRE